jgi:hypothetical protein
MGWENENDGSNMTHYKKLATMMFRTVGILLVLFGAVVALFSLPFIYSGFGVLIAVIALAPLGTGIICFGMSVKLATLVCKNFDEFTF